MADDTALVAGMQAVQDECPSYGYRRITAELRAPGKLANHKRVARLMWLHGMQVRPRRRYVATTDSNHDGPIFPNLAKDLTMNGPHSIDKADRFVADRSLRWLSEQLAMTKPQMRGGDGLNRPLNAAHQSSRKT